MPPCLYSAHCDKGTFLGGRRQCSRSFQVAGEECINLKDACCDQFLCYKDRIELLSKCYLGGEKYYHGQKFATKEDKCMECKCDESFDNSTSIYKNKNCEPIDCFEDFFHLPEYRKGCAPVYKGTDSCCPTSVKCRKCLKDSFG